MNGNGEFKLIYPPELKVIQLPICPHCRVITTNCKCGKPTPRPAA